MVSPLRATVSTHVHLKILMYPTCHRQCLSSMHLGPISRTSKKQTYVALSTTELEYSAASLSPQEEVWLLRLLQNLDETVPQPMKPYDDNSGALALATNPTFHCTIKHMEIRYSGIHDLIHYGPCSCSECAGKKKSCRGLPALMEKHRFELLALDEFWRTNCSTTGIPESDSAVLGLG